MSVSIIHADTHTPVLADFLTREAQAEIAHGHGTVLPNQRNRVSAQRFVGRFVKDIGDQPGPLGFGHALPQNIGPKIEFVISEDGDIDGGGVEGVRHLTSLVDAGRDGGRKKISRQDEFHRAAFLCNPFLHRGDTGHPAGSTTIDGQRDIDIVDLEQGQRTPCLREAFLGGQRGRADKEDGGEQTGRNCCCHTPLLHGPSQRTLPDEDHPIQALCEDRP